MANNKNSYTYLKYVYNNNRVAVISVALIIIFLIIIIWALRLNGKTQLAVIVLVLIVFKLIDKIASKKLRTNYRTWGRGAGAELRVERELDQLGPDYKRINDFQTGCGNIDHICVGPTGIFVIETKAHTGLVSYHNQLLINNQIPEKDFVNQLWAEINYLKQLLHQQFSKDYFVTGVLEFPNAKIDESIRGEKRGIRIGGAGFQNYVIKKQKSFLPTDEIIKISDFLKQKST